MIRSILFIKVAGVRQVESEETRGYLHSPPPGGGNVQRRSALAQGGERESERLLRAIVCAFMQSALNLN